MQKIYNIADLRSAIRCIVLTVIAPFLLMTILPLGILKAGAESALNLPPVGAFIKPSQGYHPAVLKGLRVNQSNPLIFDFFVDSGDSGLSGDEIRNEADKMIKYFMATLTVPENDLWVNLSPYEKERIIPDELGLTDMGRDLLAQDYLLKQVTASLIHPDERVGQEFWAKVQEKALKLYGSATMPVNTFNKVWIVPDKAVITQYQNVAFVTECSLKVMLEADYLAMTKDPSADQASEQNAKDVNDVSSSIVREIVLPVLQTEVNEGKNFAPLRQVFHSMILATWYKKNLQESVMGRVYIDQKKIAGINLEDLNIKQKIYKQYVEAFKKGVYSMIREEYDTGVQDYVPRKYFSGGVEGTRISLASSTVVVSDIASLVGAVNPAGKIVEISTMMDPSQRLTKSTTLGVQPVERVESQQEFLSRMDSYLFGNILKAPMSKMVPMERLDTSVIVSQLVAMWQNVVWFQAGHPSESGYHDVAHSLRVAALVWKLNNIQKIPAGMAMFIYQSALLHDFHPDRANNFEAFVPETIRRFEADYNRVTSLSGEQGKSMLRDEFGWTDMHLQMAKIILLQSEFPFNGKHANKEYLQWDQNPMNRYKEELQKLLQSEDFRKAIPDPIDQKRFVGFLMVQALNVSNLDQLNGYVTKELDEAVNLVKGLAVEYTNRPDNAGWWKPTEIELLSGTGNFLKVVGNNSDSVAGVAEDLLGPGFFQHLNRDAMLVMMGEEAQNFKTQLQFWAAMSTGIAENGGIKQISLAQVENVINQSVNLYSGVSVASAATTIQPENIAATPVGGINLSSDLLDLRTRGEEIQFDFNISPAMIETLPIEGFTPLIFQITPVTNLPLLLGSPDTKPFFTTL